MNTVLFLLTSLLVSACILVLSMIVASVVRGGIDFGPLPYVLVRAVPLLLAVTLLKLIPFGSLLALPVWWGGLIFLLRLDFWEVRTLTSVNWFLNIPVKVGLALLFFNPESPTWLL